MTHLNINSLFRSYLIMQNKNQSLLINKFYTDYSAKLITLEIVGKSKVFVLGDVVTATLVLFSGDEDTIVELEAELTVSMFPGFSFPTTAVLVISLPPTFKEVVLPIIS